MLLQFSCANHKSIRTKVLFSAMAGKDRSHEDMTLPISEGRVLKSAVIYGANASGKSNFIDAIAFMKNLVTRSVQLQPGQTIRQIPHKLSSADESEYEMHFLASNVHYVYGFSICHGIVTNEYLFYFPNGRQTKIFERENMSVTLGYRFRGKFKNAMEVLKENRLFLSCAANFSNIQEVLDVFRFFDHELVIYHPANQENWLNYSLYQIHENAAIKDAVIQFMRELGIALNDIIVKIDQTKIDSAQLPPILSEEFKQMLMQQNVDAISAKLEYDGITVDLMAEESTGVQKLFGLLCPLIDIMANGKILICDELESGLHEALLYGLVKLFMNYQSDKFAQLFFSTHETGLLNLDLFRRDQVWFTEMRNSDRSTDLFSLAELKSIRKDENLGKGYISGKYGAIPMLNLNFADVVQKLMG
ncbi:MAG: ATP-binding protein [Oscillospiraceae bacterium]|nr:ATP-binding protein [Oscillospiraceae bacterium]